MPNNFLKYLGSLLLLASSTLYAQDSASKRAEWGSNDTIIVSVIAYDGAFIPYKELEMVYVSHLPPHQLAKEIAKYNRLRNAVYVTYPYARTAGVTLNDVAAHLKNIPQKSERKKYIKSRERELKKQFSDPLTNLSVYQGKVLMKLINRQTGNDCYEIIKEYKGSLNARMYQTVAFFFGSSLKQEYGTVDENDRQIESIIKEIEGVWYNNPNRPVTSRVP
ncbi:MAG TPA: DUF4294 domain-containing protein [Flavisolibacter sp.]|nr:DUF4294 domain-containing protein [Flavisolibacter sp.]